MGEGDYEMTEDIVQRVKEANRVEDVIAETFQLHGSGRYLRTEQHDSLVIDTENQYYAWNSRGETGDVIDWIRERQNVGFRGAVTTLCQRVGLDEPQWGTESAQKAAVRRERYDALTVAAQHFVTQLRGDAGKVARDYCDSRGWTDETIHEARLGYVDGGRDALLAEFSMHEIDAASSGAQAALSFSSGLLVYPHLIDGRAVYLSGRSIVGKRHYNPPRDMIGGRQLYRNWLWSPKAEHLVICEGQADAVTWGQWGFSAIALAGCSVSEEVLKMLAASQSVFLALDGDSAGEKAARRLCSALGARTRLVAWPEGIRDANDALQKGVSADDAHDLLAAAETWAEVLTREAGKAEGDQRITKLRRAFGVIANLDEFEVTARRERLADLADVNLREFDRLRKSVLCEGTEQNDGAPLVTVQIAGSNRCMDGLICGHLIDLVYRPRTNGDDDKTLLVIRDLEGDGTPRIADHLDIDGIRYEPIPPNQMMREGIIQLPSDLGEAMETPELVQRIRETIHKYVDLDVFYEFLAAYYVLFTWLYDAFETLPYLRFLGEPGTGKSRTLQVVGAMCYRPITATGAATVSPMFRLMDRYRPTLLLDEGDFANSDETALVIKMLNVGYQERQAVILRAGPQDDGFSPEGFKVYGPKLIATRSKFDDWALESRCLTKHFDAPTLREDIPIDLPRSFWREEALEIRNLLLRWRMEHWQPEIELSYEGIDHSLEPRLNQVSIALMTLVDDPDLKADLQALMKRFDEQLILERSNTLECKVLEAILFLREEDGSEADLSMKSITARVNDLMDWENHREIRTPEDRQNALKPRSVGHIVKKLGLPKTRDPRTRRIAVLWDEDRMKRLRRRYGLDDAALTGVFEIFYTIEAKRQEAKSGEETPW
jgi:5S rRNA maturation endonuclease (ribonuclease M5)